MLRFDQTNWAKGQAVYVFAPDDGRAEGDRTVVIQHSVISTSALYNRVPVRNVEVTVRDNDTPGVTVVPIRAGSYVSQLNAFEEDGVTQVLEGAAGIGVTDQVVVRLGAPPAQGTTVVLDVVVPAPLAQQITLSNPLGDPRLSLVNGQWRISFTSANWDQPLILGIEARDDAAKEDPFTAAISFVRNAATTDPNYLFPNLREPMATLDVRVLDNEMGGVLVTETDGATLLIRDDLTTQADESTNDTYSIRLTAPPSRSLNVDLLTDGLADVVAVNGSPVTLGIVGELRFSESYVGAISVSGATITRGAGVAGSFVEEGFRAGELLAISGVIGSFVISSVGATQITLATAPGLSGNIASATLFEVTRDGSYSGTVNADAGARTFARTDGGSWLADGFLEGQRVRIADAQGVSGDFKIALISGANATRDDVLTLTAEGVVPPSFKGPVSLTIQRIAASVLFTQNNYFTPYLVTLRADPNFTLPPPREGVKVAPAGEHLFAAIRGPLQVEGGVAVAGRPLPASLKLPGEADSARVTVPAQPAESRQIDVLNVFNDGSQQNLSGGLTTTRLSGFGAVEGLDFGDAGAIFGEPGVFKGSIDFGRILFGPDRFAISETDSTVDVVNLLLGQGDDLIDVRGTVNAVATVEVVGDVIVASDSSGGSLQQDGIDWLAAGFLPGQTVTIAGQAGSWTVLDIKDATADPNDNSVLVLGGPSLPSLVGPQRVIATDPPAPNAVVAITAVTTTTGAIVSRTAGSWIADGFRSGQLVGLDVVNSQTQQLAGVFRLRVGEISADGLQMTLIGVNLNLATPTSFRFWVDGPHGGLTMLHGGGNQVLRTVGDMATEAGTTRLTRLDGLGWANEGFAVGQTVQLNGDNGGTRTILSIGNATAGLAPAGAFAGWGAGSTLVLSGANFTASSGPRTLSVVNSIPGAAVVTQVGGDRFVVTEGGGPASPLVIYGDTSQDGVWYGGFAQDIRGYDFGARPFDPFPLLPAASKEEANWIMPLANGYRTGGNDVIDARPLFAATPVGSLPTVGLTAYGGVGNDTIFGSQAGDHLAGGSGNDVILGQRGNDHIYGDNGANVFFQSRTLVLTAVNRSSEPTIGLVFTPLYHYLTGFQLINGTTLKPQPSAERDLLTAGSDSLEGEGAGAAAGSSATTADIIFGDLGTITQDVRDPNLPHAQLQKIQTTGSVLSFASAATSNGLRDTILGGVGVDTIVGGPGDDSISGGGQIGETIIQDNTSPLVAAAPAPAGATAPALTQADAEAMLRAARGIWARSGEVDRAELKALRAVTVTVADLPGAMLGLEADGSRIVLDRDAAALGWFIDRTPRRNEEFVAAPQGGLVAVSADAAGRMDLLTAMVHELGHVLGLEHAAEGVMAEALDVGRRLLPEGGVTVAEPLALSAPRIFHEGLGGFVDPATGAWLDRNAVFEVPAQPAAAPAPPAAGGVDWSRGWRGAARAMLGL